MNCKYKFLGILWMLEVGPVQAISRKRLSSVRVNTILRDTAQIHSRNHSIYGHVHVLNAEIYIRGRIFPQQCIKIWWFLPLWGCLQCNTQWSADIRRSHIVPVWSSLRKQSPSSCCLVSRHHTGSARHHTLHWFIKELNDFSASSHAFSFNLETPFHWHAARW